MADQQPTWGHSIPRDQPWGGCRACQHYAPGDKCAAFPDRIPLAILSGEVDHLVVRPGQVGDTVFETPERPTGLALLRIQAGVKHGEAWALKALAKAEPSLAGRDTY